MSPKKERKKERRGQTYGSLINLMFINHVIIIIIIINFYYLRKKLPLSNHHQKLKTPKN
jgi:uncharacterized membrane protein YciS (DUF1049 family)